MMDMKQQKKEDKPAPWQHLMDVKKQRPQNFRIQNTNNNRAPRRFAAKTRPGEK
jgi:hypothetical protein